MSLEEIKKLKEQQQSILNSSLEEDEKELEEFRKKQKALRIQKEEQLKSLLETEERLKKEEHDRAVQQAIQSRVSTNTFRSSTFGRLGDAIRSLNIPETIKSQHLTWIDGTDNNDNGTREYTEGNTKYILKNSRQLKFFEHKCFVEVTTITTA